MTDLTSRLSKCYASAIHDVLREKGYGNCVLPPEIQALERGQKLFGEIYTVSGHVDKTLSRHCLLYTSPSPRDMWTSRMPSSA